MEFRIHINATSIAWLIRFSHILWRVALSNKKKGKENTKSKQFSFKINIIIIIDNENDLINCNGSRYIFPISGKYYKTFILFFQLLCQNIWLYLMLKKNCSRK